jgi:transcriptional regulator with XRE-family HTH domain
LNHAFADRYHAGVTFLIVLRTEFERRRTANPRYSLRSFARDLSVDHSTLSQILRGTRRLTGRNVRALGRRLRLDPTDLAEFCALENESAVLSALDRPAFQADSRWVASQLGIPLDEVNITLQRLLRKRIVTMTARARWVRNQEA